MILETFSKEEIASTLLRENTESRIKSKVFGSPEMIKAKKAFRELWRSSRTQYPVVLKKPVKMILGRDEYYAVFVSPVKGRVDAETYLRVYSGKLRRYRYYTFPVIDDTAGSPAGYCFEFSQEFISDLSARNPWAVKGTHWLSALVKDQTPESSIVPIGLSQIWVPTRTGIILLKDNSYSGYYQSLRDFTLDLRESYLEYWKRYGDRLPIPSLPQLLVKMWKK